MEERPGIRSRGWMQNWDELSLWNLGRWSQLLMGSSMGSSTECRGLGFFVCLFYNFYFFIFYFCHTMQHVGSLFPNQGSNLCHLQWKHGVLTTELPGKSQGPGLLYGIHYVGLADSLIGWLISQRLGCELKGPSCLLFLVWAAPLMFSKGPPTNHLISINLWLVAVVQSLSHVWLFATPWTAARSPSLSLHARLACPSLSPRVWSKSCPLSQWCHPAISSSATSFSSCPQSFPALGSFPMSQVFAQVTKVLELQLQHQF